MLVDVSHVVEHGMVTYKGLPAPLVCDFLSREQSRSHYAPGTEFHIGKIEMVANTGTYLALPPLPQRQRPVRPSPGPAGEPGRHCGSCCPVERAGRQPCGLRGPR